MAWFSILPKSLVFVETWIIRIFIVLGVIVIAPWLLLIVYDAALYIIRVTTYELPFIGGRARNRPRPRAPSLSERPSGRPRIFNMGLPGLASSTETTTEDIGDVKKRLDRPERSRNSSSELEDE